MNYNSLILVTLFTLTMSNKLFSQKENQDLNEISQKAINSEQLMENTKKVSVKDYTHLIGTYQIQYVKENIALLLDDAILEQIEKLRKTNEDVYLDYSDGIKIYIPSRNKIQSPNFIALKSYVVL
jgi:hypothetical protein